MKKWPFILPVCIVLVVFWMTRAPSPEVPQAEAQNQTSLSAPQINDSAPVALPTPRLPSSRSSRPLRERLDPSTPLLVGSKSYELHESLVALDRARALELGVRVQQTLGAWVLVDVSEASGEGLPVLKRSGGGELGVFRGVLKTLSQEILSENGPWSECPGRVLSAHPEIKVYLFELNSEASPEELKQCLIETRLFNRLEWEILDQPRLSR
ncbi:MAG: hypothetical protein LW878_01030 [Proteobacteria bacterium]|nr:hypothetical protein [Pseudomonadota bacterium]